MTTKERFTAYITKYALTEGIFEAEGEESNGYFYYGKGGYDRNQACPEDWHRTREEAVARAEDMRKRKIASLKKSIAKMEALRFS